MKSPILTFLVSLLSTLTAPALAHSHSESCPQLLRTRDVAHALSQLEIIAKNGARFELIPVIQKHGIEYNIYSRETFQCAGKGNLPVAESQFPYLYGDSCVIQVAQEFQRQGIGEAIYRELYRIAPAGTILKLASTNYPTNEALEPIFKAIARGETFQALVHEDSKKAARYLSERMTRFVQSDLQAGSAPLWPTLLHKVGWKNIEIEIFGIPMGVEHWIEQDMHYYLIQGTKE